MSCNGDEECDIRPGTVTPKKLPKQSGGGGHEFVTDLPETGDEGVEYVLMDDFSDCSTYRGTFVWNEDCGGWIQTSGSGGGAIERYTFEQTATGWRAKRNNTVIFTYVDKDTIDSYENTADGFQITRNGVVIFTHTDGGGGDCKEYTITSTADGWVFKEDGVTKFTYTEPANDPSDGTYFTSGTLTTAITGTTTVAASSVTGLTLADVVIGETLIYDEAGSVGRVTAVNGTNLTVETITTAPGERRGTRLGAVDDYTDLPATCAAAVALGWQTPLAGDFAYVREDTSHDSHLTEWVISNIDSSCNITWAYSHTLNAGNYVLDIYKYGDYPSGSPIPKNPDGSVTLPKDEDTKYDFETIMDGTTVKGWRVKDHDSGTVLYTYTDQNDNDTYTFEDVTVSGSVVGWRVKDKNGTVIYTYTDLNDKSDGTYFTSATLDTDITDQTTVAASTVTGLTLADVVVGETLIYDGDGTVGVVTAVNGTDLTVDTITVAGSGDASSYVYKTTGTLDTTVDNTVNLALSTLSNSAGTTPTASDIIIGKTLAWDGDGTVALAVAIADPSVTFKTMTLSGAGGGSYLVDKNGDAVKSAMFKLIQSGKADTPNNNDFGNVQVAKNAIIPFHKISGDFEEGSTQGTFKVPDGMRIEANYHMTLCDGSTGSGGYMNIRVHLYNVTDSVYCKGDSNENMPSAYTYTGEYGSGTYSYSGYAMGRSGVFQWTNNTGHTVELGFRVGNFDNSQSGMPAKFRTDATSMAVKEIGRYVDPIKYLDNSEGLQDTPVGNIISYMGNNVPRHYLACDGTIYNIGDYPALEAHFVEEFGRVNYFGGNGTTTWAVPDLQGEFLRGTGTNSHANQGNGANVGVHQDATEMPYMQGSSGNLGGRTKDSNTSHEVVAEYKNVDSELGAPGNLKYASGFTNNVSNVTPDFTSRPTNTSVKYCIKYESTMQVILGNEQYKVQAKITSWGTTAGSFINFSTTPENGDASMIKDATHLVAPVTGWYQLGTQLTTSSSPAATHTTVYINDANTKGREWQTHIGHISTLHLDAGDTVSIARQSAGQNESGWVNLVLLTSSVDINEINLIAADDVYSTDEQLVGSYLGKPLYKKTFDAVLDTLGKRTISELPSTIDKFVKITGTCIDTQGWTIPVGTQPQSGLTEQYLSVVGGFNPANALWFSYGNLLAGQTAKITCYYTKTSDTAGSAPNKNSLLLTRPDLWTPGTEYDFGGGLYGMRKQLTLPTNTHTPVTDMTYIQFLPKNGNDYHIFNWGGNLYKPGSWRLALPYNHQVAGNSTCMYADTGGSGAINFQYNYGVAQGGTSNTIADIWLTYTKA